MKQLSTADWVSVSFAFIGVAFSILAAVSGSDGGFLYNLGGLLTLVSIGIAIFGFVSRARRMRDRK